MTRLLPRSDIERLLDLDSALESIRAGFATAHEVAIEPRRVSVDLPGPGSATVLIAGLLPGIPAYTVKVNAKFPGVRPALRGIVALHDLQTGALLALADSASVTGWRTGLASALATHQLARHDGVSVAVIGCGAQAWYTMKGLLHLRRIERVVVADIDTTRAWKFADAIRRVAGIPAVVADSPSAAVARANIVLVATWSRRPLLDVDDIAPGVHVTAIGTDEAGKVELSADLLLSSKVFVDDLVMAEAVGALAGANLDREAASGTFGDVLRGLVAGRSGPDDITVFAGVGMPWQDLALTWPLYLAASEAGVGAPIDLLA